MTRTKAAILLTAIIGSSTMAAVADAGGRHHRHHHHRSHVGIFFGVPAPVFYPRYHYYPRYYYPPAVVAAPAYPPVYIEQSPPIAAAPAQSSASWYYCRDTQTYYPYVQQCASPWERVAPQSAPPS